jgi:anti-sigma-K factor RskA
MSESFGLHVEELVDGYALGSLTPDEASHVEAHIASCQTCRDRLREAEEAVTALIEAGEMHEAPADLRGRIVRASRRPAAPISQSWAALAAAFVLGLVPAAWLFAENRRAGDVTLMQNAAIGSLVHSHFSHAPFTPLAADAPSAKVIFPRDGSWFYVVIAAHSDGLQIGTMNGAQVRLLGAPADFGESSAYYTTSAGRLNNLVIVRDGRVVARAPIVAQLPAK